MDGQMQGRMGRWTDAQTDGQMDGWTDARTDGQTDGQTYTYRQTNIRQTDRRILGIRTWFYLILTLFLFQSFLSSIMFEYKSLTLAKLD